MFEEENGRATVRMNMLFPTAGKRKEAVEFGAVEGGHQTLSRLADFLERRKMIIKYSGYLLIKDKSYIKNKNPLTHFEMLNM